MNNLKILKISAGVEYELLDSGEGEAGKIWQI